jgi:hypothetical protein
MKVYYIVITKDRHFSPSWSRCTQITPYLSKIFFNIILQSTSMFPSGVLSSDFPNYNSVYFSDFSPAWYMNSHLILTDLILIINEGSFCYFLTCFTGTLSVFPILSLRIFAMFTRTLNAGRTVAKCLKLSPSKIVPLQILTVLFCMFILDHSEKFDIRTIFFKKWKLLAMFQIRNPA